MENIYFCFKTNGVQLWTIMPDTNQIIFEFAGHSSSKSAQKSYQKIIEITCKWNCSTYFK